MNINNIEQSPYYHKVMFKKIIKDLMKIIRGCRKIMYSDIINLIIRDGHKRKEDNLLII